MEKLVLVDLSFLMHSSKHAFKTLSIKIVQNGIVKEQPTGHVFGTLRTILSLAQNSELVYLCVDSKSKKRTELLKSYKADRPKDGYNIYADQYNLLAIASALKNVFYVKIPEMEADDIISSYVKDCPKYGIEPAIFSTDNDQMQTNAPFKMFSSLTKTGEFFFQNIPEYIEAKYGYRLPYLPVWEKTLRGDPSDKVPKAAPRYDQSVLQQIILDNKDHQDLDKFIAYLKEKHPGLINKYPGFIETVTNNFQVVIPEYRDITTFEYKKVQSETPIRDLLAHYQLNSLREHFL